MRADRERIAGVVIVAAATVLGCVLRLGHLDRISLWLDEILAYDLATHAMHQPWWQWLIGPALEQGPLFFALQLAVRIVPSIEISARMVPALCGVATIPAVAWAMPKRSGVIAACLLAVAPLHVYYSREGRPYGALMLLAVLALAALLKENAWLFAIAIAGAAYTTEVSGPLIIACGVAALATKRRRFAAIAFGAAVLLPLLYRHPPNVGIAAFPAINARFANELVQNFALQVLPPFELRFAAYAVLLLAILGAVALPRRDRIMVTLLAIVPVAAGMIVLHHLKHWYSVRYVCAALPAYLLLAAAGIDAIANSARIRQTIAVAIVIALGAKMWPAARTETYRGLDWRLVASTLSQHARPNDTILAANDWTAVSLEFYLHRRVIDAHESVAIATQILQTHAPVWIVSAGYEDDPSVTNMSCAYPLLLASSRENLRLHYAPSFAHFVQNRALPADLHTLAAQYASDGCTITCRAPDDIFFISGWGGIEGDKRWALNREASLLLPIDGAIDRTIRFRAMPIDAQQRVHVMLDGAPLGDIAMKSGWNDYELSAPASAWRGARHVLTMQFSESAVPLHDTRALSAMFETISVARTGHAAPAPLPFHPIALGMFDDVADSFLARSACIDDATFLRYAYWSLARRDVGDDYARSITSHWRDRRERSRLVRGILQTRAK